MASYKKTLSSIWNTGKKVYKDVNKAFDNAGWLGKATKTALKYTISPGVSLIKDTWDTGKDLLGFNNKKQETTSNESSISDILSKYTSTPTTSGGSGGGGYYSSSYGSYGASPADLYEAERDAYNKQYEASVAAARTANEQDLKSLKDYLDRTVEDIERQRTDTNKYYDTKANALLKSLTRFQEQNAEDSKLQRQNFLTSQAGLELNAAQAARQSRIDAARRGLGGSGLQQLAQLQNLITQGQDISALSKENQNVMDNLRKQLKQATEDYEENKNENDTARESAINNLNTTLARARADYDTNVRNANDNLRDLLAGYEASRATNDVGALSNLYSRVSSENAARSAASSNATKYNNLINTAILSYADDLSTNLAGIKNNSKKNNNIDTTVSNALSDIFQNYGEYMTPDQYRDIKNTFTSIGKQYKTNK